MYCIITPHFSNFLGEIRKYEKWHWTHNMIHSAKMLHPYSKEPVPGGTPTYITFFEAEITHNHTLKVTLI
jgi:hypothetical protein